MQTAELFLDGKNQAVRLPNEYRFSGDEVFVKRVGQAVVLLPHDAPWQPLIDSLAMFTDDFMASRSQPPLQDRESVFE